MDTTSVCAHLSKDVQHFWGGTVELVPASTNLAVPSPPSHWLLFLCCYWIQEIYFSITPCLFPSQGHIYTSFSLTPSQVSRYCMPQVLCKYVGNWSLNKGPGIPFNSLPEPPSPSLCQPLPGWLVASRDSSKVVISNGNIASLELLCLLDLCTVL